MPKRNQASQEANAFGENLILNMNNGISTSTQSFGISDGRRSFQRKRRCYVLCLAGILIAFAGGFVLGYFIPKCSDEEPSTNADNVDPSSARKSFERQLLSILDSKSIENVSRAFSSRPHIAASRRSLDIASEIKNKWEEFGFDNVVLPSYEVLLSFPKPNTANKVNIITKAGQIIYESVRQHGDDDGVVPAFLAYSASGVVEGDLVYVNYGTQQDFEELERHNISIKGRIAIVRYGLIYRGSKVAIAARRGAIGVLIYPDPANFAPYDHYYPQSWFLPPNATQRGSVYPGPSFGDPLTHGLPATPGMVRSNREEVNLPRIPAHVLTYGEAVHFLKRMTGNEVPSKWKGSLNITYRFGPGFRDANTTVRLNITTENTLANITNVIATVKGNMEPDRIVLVGTHRDSWVYGAVDAVSATSIMMELSRAVGILLKSGWRPRRTIMFCSWAAEEYALIGSTEWVEENYKLLSERAVAYLNLDLAVNGNFSMRTFSSPLLNELIIDSLKNVTDPTSSEPLRTVYDVMVDREPSPDGPKPNLRTLGTISDYASFYQYLAIPSIDWGYYFTDKKAKVFFYPVYHSSVETFEWVKNFIDPQFKIHLAVARVGGIFLMQLVDSPLLPMNSVSSYTNVLEKSLETLQKDPLNRNISLEHLKKAVEEFNKAAIHLEKHLKQFRNEKDPVKLRILNDQMRQIEKSFLYPDGLPGRNEFKHIIFAPSLYNTYASASFPGITDALFQCNQRNNTSDCREAHHQISIATHTIRQATRMLKPIF